VALVVIRTFFHHIQADLARSALGAAGIESTISADDAGGMWPGGNRVRLLVEQEDAEAADEILQNSETSSGSGQT
jgi:hypothetical protein